MKAAAAVLEAEAEAEVVVVAVTDTEDVDDMAGVLSTSSSVCWWCYKVVESLWEVVDDGGEQRSGCAVGAILGHVIDVRCPQ